ncbi:MAG: hypothetical protein IJ088_08905 [Clostridia bacterium]|nr:hypothetical protein [Clostridia bacterium]
MSEEKHINLKRVLHDSGPSHFLGKGTTSLRKSFGFVWKNKYAVFLCFLLMCLLMNLFFYIRSLSTASTIVSLDYESASKGLTPSQTRFNISQVVSAEVLERLIDYAGLEGEIGVEDLRNCISVKATHNRNISGKVNYISTSYNINFTNANKIPKRSAEAMLSLLCKAYREYFIEHYGFNHSILSFDIDSLKFGNEYLMTVDLLKLKCSQLEKYVQLRKRENKNYQDSETGLTFSALEQRVTNFNAYSLSRLRSYVIENGIASEKTDLISMLDYKNRMDRIAYDKFMAAYDEDNKGIQMYDSAMSAIVMIPTEDKTSKYYMSRTKTGMDNMAIHADGQLVGATEKQDSIEYNTYLIGKMRSAHPLESQRKKADEMILQMQTALESLASDIRKMDNSYTQYKARNYLSFRSRYIHFIERIDIFSSVLGAFVLMAGLFTLMFLCEFIRSEKKR